MRSTNADTPETRMSVASPASAKLPSGTMARPRPAARTAIRLGSTPGTGRTCPSSPSSPISTASAAASAGTTPAAASTATANARSKPAPRLGRPAGDRARVILRSGHRQPELCKAARIRSRACTTAVSPRPITVVPGSPGARSASTVIRVPDRPANATAQVRASAMSERLHQMGQFRSMTG